MVTLEELLKRVEIIEIKLKLHGIYIDDDKGFLDRNYQELKAELKTLEEPKE